MKLLPNQLRFSLFAMVLLALMGRAFGVTQLTRGTVAPAIALKDSSGAEVNTEKLRDRILVVVFGEAYHDKTRQACTELATVLNDPRFAGQAIMPILIVAQEIKPDDLKLGAGEKLPATILRDTNRQAYGAYQVAVMPSVVVIDKEGKVVHAIAGLTTRFSDVLTDSLLLATGKLGPAAFEEALHPAPTTDPGTPDVRAERLAQLARQLARRGLDDMAAEKFQEALQLNPSDPSIHLDMGMLLLKRQRLPDAEAQFREVLKTQPGSMDASLGLAFVQTLRGGPELDPAERTVRDLLARNPNQPRAHYLMGLINEQRGKPQDAAASFKKAAQLLLERGEEAQP